MEERSKKNHNRQEVFTAGTAVYCFPFAAVQKDDMLWTRNQRQTTEGYWTPQQSFVLLADPETTEQRAGRAGEIRASQHTRHT